MQIINARLKHAVQRTPQMRWKGFESRQYVMMFLIKALRQELQLIPTESSLLQAADSRPAILLYYPQHWRSDLKSNLNFGKKSRSSFSIAHNLRYI